MNKRPKILIGADIQFQVPGPHRQSVRDADAELRAERVPQAGAAPRGLSAPGLLKIRNLI